MLVKHTKKDLVFTLVNITIPLQSQQELDRFTTLFNWTRLSDYLNDPDNQLWSAASELGGVVQKGSLTLREWLCRS